jgi:hypothetical protein
MPSKSIQTDKKYVSRKSPSFIAAGFPLETIKKSLGRSYTVADRGYGKRWYIVPVSSSKKKTKTKKKPAVKKKKKKKEKAVDAVKAKKKKRRKRKREKEEAAAVAVATAEKKKKKATSVQAKVEAEVKARKKKKTKKKKKKKKTKKRSQMDQILLDADKCIAEADGHVRESSEMSSQAQKHLTEAFKLVAALDSQLDILTGLDEDQRSRRKNLYQRIGKIDKVIHAFRIQKFGDDAKVGTK